MQIEIVEVKKSYEMQYNHLVGNRQILIEDIEFKIDDIVFGVTSSGNYVSAQDTFYIKESKEIVKLKNSTLELLRAELQLFKIKQERAIKTF